jgi:single-strand DNA-binding protein
MGSVNSVFLMGNLTFDPVLRRTPSGVSVADLRLAVSENYRNKEGKEVKSTCFTDVVTWGKQAESCAEFLAKGSAVLVEGRLQFDQWDTPQGEKRSKLRVRAHRVQFLGRRHATDSGENNANREEAESVNALDV